MTAPGSCVLPSGSRGLSPVPTHGTRGSSSDTANRVLSAERLLGGPCPAKGPWFLRIVPARRASSGFPPSDGRDAAATRGNPSSRPPRSRSGLRASGRDTPSSSTKLLWSSRLRSRSPLSELSGDWRRPVCGAIRHRPGSIPASRVGRSCAADFPPSRMTRRSGERPSPGDNAGPVGDPHDLRWHRDRSAQEQDGNAATCRFAEDAPRSEGAGGSPAARQRVEQAAGSTRARRSRQAGARFSARFFPRRSPTARRFSLDSGGDRGWLRPSRRPTAERCPAGDRRARPKEKD